MFRALNLAEVILAAVLTAACAAALRPENIGWALLTAAWGLLAVQILLLRPRLDRRALQIVAGDDDLPPSRQHLAYIALEGAKIVVLVVLGGILLTTST